MILCLMTPLAMLAGPRLLAQEAAPEPESSKYVGVEVCQSCHEDAYNSFAKSAHIETLKSKSAATRGCEGCHGPGAEHVNAGGDPDQIERYGA